MYPVCSPDLLKGPNALTSPDRLRQHVLLHDDSPDEDVTCPNWPMWLKAAGVAVLEAARGPRFNQSSLVLEAAILGRGVALANRLWPTPIRGGPPGRPVRRRVPVNFAYYVVYPETKSALPKVRLFHDWLRQEAQADQAKAPRAIPLARTRLMQQAARLQHA